MHSFLADVPIHDVWSVELPGGGAQRSIEDLRAIFALERVAETNAAVRALFRLRLALGRWFGWDAESRKAAGLSYADRLSEDAARAAMPAYWSYLGDAIPVGWRLLQGVDR